ncbi:MAG: hypothetical protein KBB19_13960 [Giesbergeria sp.]|nr:hypothetical protein [Giesbergeria sp.]OQC23707.1 MAG: hypothetical protein BWX68_02657 [Verrucomicrobia bacterium ADurb.Bin063]
MAKLLHAKRASRRFSDVVRTWLALRQQRRRRGGLGTPASPVITALNLTESAGEPLYWFDVLVDFTFEQGRFPDGTIELYWSRGSQGWVENYVGAVASTTRQFRHVRAFSDFENDDVRYWMRYRCGADIVGPFGPVYQWYYCAP